MYVHTVLRLGDFVELVNRRTHIRTRKRQQRLQGRTAQLDEPWVKTLKQCLHTLGYNTQCGLKVGVCTWLHFVLVALHSRLVCVYGHPGTNNKRSQVAFVVRVRSIVLSLGHLGGKIIGASQSAQSLRETCSKN